MFWAREETDTGKISHSNIYLWFNFIFNVIKQTRSGWPFLCTGLCFSVIIGHFIQMSIMFIMHIKQQLLLWLLELTDELARFSCSKGYHFNGFSLVMVVKIMDLIHVFEFCRHCPVAGFSYKWMLTVGGFGLKFHVVKCPTSCLRVPRLNTQSD